MSDWFYLYAPLEDAEVAAVNGAGYVLEKSGSPKKLYKCKFNPGNLDGFASFSVNSSGQYFVTLYGEKEKGDTLSKSKFLSTTSVKVNNGPRAKFATLSLPSGWSWTGEDTDSPPDPENSAIIEDQNYTKAPAPAVPGSTDAGGVKTPPPTPPAAPDAAAGGGSDVPAAQTSAQRAVVVDSAALASAAKSLSRTYENLKTSPQGFQTKDIVESFAASAPGESWTSAHVSLLYNAIDSLSATTALDPGLVTFQSSVRSTTEDSRVTTAAVKALQDYVSGKGPRYSPSIKGFARSADDAKVEVLDSTTQANVFSAALACIVTDILAAKGAAARREEETSPQLQSNWPAHDDRRVPTRDDSADLVLSTIGLNVQVSTHPGDPTVYGLPPSEVVLTVFAEPSSFAEKIKELPGLFSPRGGRTRKAAVLRGAGKLDERRVLQEATVDPSTAETSFFGITSIPTQGLKTGTHPTSIDTEKPRPPDPGSEDTDAGKEPQFSSSSLPDLDFDGPTPEAEPGIPQAPEAPGSRAVAAETDAETPGGDKDFAVSALPADLEIPEDEIAQGQTASPAPTAPTSAEEDNLLVGRALTVPEAPASVPEDPAPTAPAAPPKVADQPALTPASIGSDCSAVVSNLNKSYLAWDLLSLQEDDKYYVAERLSIAFQSGRPSMNYLKNMYDKNVVIQIDYQGRFRSIDDAFLRQPGKGSVTAQAVFGPEASVKQGALKFVECFLVDKMDEAGFFARG